MFFPSDNAAGVHPDILAAITQAADGPAVAYGSDDLTIAA
jgi:threonine aldolase